MKYVQKRDGSTIKFEKEKIRIAVEKAAKDALGQLNWNAAREIANSIANRVETSSNIWTVEDIQDEVETLLMSHDAKVAKAYILYRNERQKRRNQPHPFTFVSAKLLSKYKHLPEPFPTELGKIVNYRTYSRPVESENRREHWWETVARVVEYSSFLEQEAIARKRPVTEHDIARLKKEAEDIFDAIFHLKLFPSGRTLWTGNTSSSKAHPLSNFNCSFVTIDEFKKFSEIFSVLMLGTGVGLSVEKKYINLLPRINTQIEVIHRDVKRVEKQNRKEFTELKQMADNVLEIVVGDSKFAWSTALDLYFQIISQKQYSEIEFVLINYDNVRPAGERLKTFGGYASGEQAIKQMFEKINQLVISKQGLAHWYKIKPIDALDLATIIAENVISGGVRRSSEIVFCDPDEVEVITAKNNLFVKDVDGKWSSNSDLIHRSLSNNTIMYKEKPTKEQLATQFQSMRFSGEPGFGNMAEILRRRPDGQGSNPCFEILLRDRGVCNLTEVNLMGFVNSDGSFNKADLLKTQKLSAKIGYRMATTELEIHEWNLVNQEDMLTGCSLTGVMDFVNATQISEDNFAALLKELRETARKEADRLADFLGTNKSKLVTTIKPSGTISQLPTVSSGVHFSHSPYFIRRVRINANDPMSKALKAAKFPWQPENGQTVEDHTTAVFEIPVKAPEGRTKYDVGAIEQLELYKLIMKNYVDHNASNTIHVREHEWGDVETWVYENWDDIVGVTFLSLDDSFYQLMPYEAIDRAKYEELAAQLPVFNPTMLKEFENFVDEFELDADCDTGLCPVR